MSDQGKANYEAHRKAGGSSPFSEWLEYDELPAVDRAAFDAGADAVELWLSQAPVDEDAPGSEPAKVIVVVEAPVGKQWPIERRYLAHEADDHRNYGFLRIRRDDRPVASYAQGAWLSVREADATVPDATVRALGIAKRALQAIRAEAEKRGDAEFFDVCADDALGEIYVETEEAEAMHVTRHARAAITSARDDEAFTADAASLDSDFEDDE